MIGLIIFSKDRALQLHGLLTSLKVNCDIFSNIDIICKWSDAEFEKGYMELAQNGYVGYEQYWWENGDMPIKERVLESMTSEYTCFMVDDLIAYSKPPTDIQLFSNEVCFSLRLGANIRHSTFSLGRGLQHQWDWTQHSKYWAYPLSVDGHIYKTDYIKPIIKGIKFDSPNKLEAYFQGYVYQSPKYMSCFNQSVVVSIPINRVSDTASAVYGEFYPHTAKELNDKFLAGERMDWEAMDFSEIKTPHQEVELKFKQC